MLFPLNNDTLILFLEKKLFGAGNKYEEKTEAGKYAKSADSGSFSIYSCFWTISGNLRNAEDTEICKRRCSEYPETCKIRCSDELKTCKIRHSSLFFLIFVRPEKTTGLGCGKGERENRDKFKYKK